MRDLAKKYFALIEKQQNSKLTMKAFSDRHGINIKTLYHWKKKYCEMQKAAGRVSKTGFTALSIVESPKEAGVIIQYPDGTRLMFSNSSNAPLIKQFLPAFGK